MRSIAIIVAVSMFLACLPFPVSARNGWISIVSPTEGDSITGSRAEVSISFNTGSSDKVTRIELLVDGAQYGVRHLSDATDRGIFSFLVDTTKLGNGGHTFLVKVYSGNKLIGSTSGNYRISNLPVDVISPDLKFVGIKKGQVFSGIAELQISARDNGLRNPLVSVFVDDALKLIKNIPPYTYTWDTTLYVDGRHTIQARAYDDAGNKTESDSIEVFVNNSAKPVVASNSVEPEKVEQPKKQASVKVASTVKEKPEPVIPIARNSKASAARSVTSPSKVSRANTVPAKSDREKPVIVKEPDPVVENETVTETAVEQVVPAVDDEPVVKTVEQSTEPGPADAEPVSTVPEIKEDAAKSAPKVAEALPSGVTAPAVTITPKAPVAVKEPAAKVKSTAPVVKTAPKTVKVALAPKLETSAAKPSIETNKVKIKLNSQKRKGIIVTEFRSVIERAGGAIISWDNRKKVVFAIFGKKKIKIKIGDRTVVIDGKNVALNSLPYINENDRIVVETKLLQSLLGTRLLVNKITGKCTLITS